MGYRTVNQMVEQVAQWPFTLTPEQHSLLFALCHMHMDGPAPVPLRYGRVRELTGLTSYAIRVAISGMPGGVIEIYRRGGNHPPLVFFPWFVPAGAPAPAVEEAAAHGG